MEVNKVLCGNALDVLKTLTDNSISCCVTSPPYYFMRSYNTEPAIWGGDPECEHEWNVIRTPDPNGSGGKTDFIKNTRRRKGKENISEYVDYNDRAIYGKVCLKCNAVKCELGQEPSVEIYLKNLLSIFDEVYRVLRNDGTLFVNIADKFGGSGNGSWNVPIEIRGKQYRKTLQSTEQEYLAPALPHNQYAKSLLLIPERFVIAMADNGWIVRNKNIWYKVNAMPESCKDRFSRSYEFVYMFTKKKQYYFEQQFEPLMESSKQRYKSPFVFSRSSAKGNFTILKRGKDIKERVTLDDSLGRNKRDVFIQSTRPTKIRHFATYPIELISPLIQAGCPEFICKNCGKPRRKIFNQEKIDTRPGLNVNNGKSGSDYDPNQSLHTSELSKYRQQIINNHCGWKECGCNNPDYQPGIVLDPFGGISTTAIAAKRLNRSYITIDLNSQYVEWAKERIENDLPKSIKVKKSKPIPSDDNQLYLF